MKESMQQMKLETITPERATKDLGASTGKNFRRLDERYAQRLAADIKAGRWRLNGETIKYNCDGSLKDGQHRLRAVVIADTTIKSWVLRGLDDDVALDTGMKRTIAQTLHNAGYSDTNNLAAALMWMHKYKTGRMGINKGGSGATASQILVLAGEHPGMADSLRRSNACSHIINRSCIAFVHYVGGKQDADRMEAFVDALANGENLAPDNPALLLRERMLKNQHSKLRLFPIEKMALVIKAWCYFRDGRAIDQLKWTSGGDRPEAFPDIDEQ